MSGGGSLSRTYVHILYALSALDYAINVTSVYTRAASRREDSRSRQFSRDAGSLLTLRGRQVAHGLSTYHGGKGLYIVRELERAA
jgi:hypothetical protein